MNPRVLLVEHNPLLAHLLEALMNSLGCRTSRVGSVRDATTWLESRRPDLMLVDDDLPDGNSWDVAEAARSIHTPAHGHRSTRPPLTTIAMRTPSPPCRHHRGQPSVQHAKDAQLRVFALPKPVDLLALQRLVQQCLTAAQAAPIPGPDTDPRPSVDDDTHAAPSQSSLQAVAWVGLDHDDDDEDDATPTVNPPSRPSSRDDHGTTTRPWWQR
jgi:CheY-like chemotaxis protein